MPPSLEDLLRPAAPAAAPPPGDLSRFTAAFRAPGEVARVPRGDAAPTPAAETVDRAALERYLEAVRRQSDEEVLAEAAQEPLPAPPAPAGDLGRLLEGMRDRGELRPEVAAWADGGTRVPPPTPPDPAPPGDAGLRRAPAESHCPRCFHDLGRALPEEPTDAEKRAYLATWLADDEEAARYTEVRSYLGGEVEAVFRTLSAAEQEAVGEQAAADQRAGVVAAGLVPLMARMGEYRFLLGTDCLRRQGREEPLGRVASRALLRARGAGEPTGVVLARLLAHAGPTVLRSDSLRQALMVDYERFAQKVALLQARATDPNSWPPTASRA